MEEKVIITEIAEQGKDSLQQVSRPKSRKVSFDVDGNLRTNNLSAYWLPAITVTKVVHGTTYIVTGSYEGTDSIVPKIERMLVRDAMNESREDADDHSEPENDFDEEAE